MAERVESTWVNPDTGISLGVGPFPYSYIKPVVAFGTLIAFGWMFGLVSDRLAIFLFFVFCIAFFLLTGNKPWRFYERFCRPRLLVRQAPRVDWQHCKGLPMPQQMRPQFMQHRGKRTKVWPVEAEFDLVGYGRSVIEEPEIGFYVLRPRRDAPGGGRQQFAFVFVWEVWGYDPMLLEKEAQSAIGSLELGFRRMTRNHLLTFEHTSTSEDDEYQRHLDRLLEQADNPLAKALIYSQKAKIRDLCQRGMLQAKRTRIFIRYQIASAHDQHKVSPLDHVMGLIDSLVSDHLMPFLDQINQTDHHSQQQQRQRRNLFIAAYKQQRNLHTLLNDTMRLEARPLTLEELYEDDYAVLHNLSAPPLNQVFILSRKGVTVQTRPGHHVLAQLFQPERGIDPTPKTGNEWIYLPSKRLYASYMQIGKIDVYLEDEGADRGMIRYLWNPITLSGMKDYKIVTQAQMIFQEGQKFDLGRQVRNSKRLVADAERRNTVDIKAEDRLANAVEGLHDLHSGRKIYETATVIWLYRKNPEALKDDFETLVSLITTPNTEVTKYAAEYAWYQSWPFARHRLLTKPHERLHAYYSHELPGLLPLVSPLTLHKQGLFFLTREGGVAVFIDLFNELTHLAIFATTRGGKSIILGDVMSTANALGIPVVAFDYPKETTGASTFTDQANAIRALGGSAGYNNIADCFTNLMQMADLRHVNNRAERFAGILDFQLRALMVLVMGELSNPQSMHEQIFKQSVKNLLSQSLKDFHNDPHIKGRYEASIAAGHNTPEHQNEPTLKDFEPHFAQWFGRYKAQNAETFAEADREAGAFILSQLRGLLNTHLGDSISRPSTFEANATLLVFALKGISDNYQAAVYALAAYSALLQRALSQPTCLFILDECPILFKFDAISDIVAQLCANGLKWGVRVILSGQTPKIIYSSSGGDAIKATVTKVLLGYIVSDAVDSFVETLKFRRDVIEKYGTKKCETNKVQMRSSWCLKEGDRHIDLYYYPSDLLLSLLANNNDEQAARDRFFAAYPHDPLKALAEFRQQYVPALRSGISMADVKPKALPPQQPPFPKSA